MKKALYQNGNSLWKKQKKRVEFGLEQNDSAYMDMCLYSYLYKCLLVSTKHYKKCIIDIERLRKIVNIMYEFNDIHEVYNIVSEVISNYKEELNKTKNRDDLVKDEMVTIK